MRKRFVGMMRRLESRSGWLRRFCGALAGVLRLTGLRSFVDPFLVDLADFVCWDFVFFIFYELRNSVWCLCVLNECLVLSLRREKAAFFLFLSGD